jgi:hypothetical protein
MIQLTSLGSFFEIIQGKTSKAFGANFSQCL